ncbi:hypothetical protein KCU89_g130, partial [Aureobasidium melanogenum]
MARQSSVSLSRSLSDDQRKRPGGACMKGDLYFPWYRYLQVYLALCILSPVFQWITHLSYSQALTHTASGSRRDFAPSASRSSTDLRLWFTSFKASTAVAAATRAGSRADRTTGESDASQ